MAMKLLFFVTLLITTILAASQAESQILPASFNATGTAMCPGNTDHLVIMPNAVVQLVLERKVVGTAISKYNGKFNVIVRDLNDIFRSFSFSFSDDTVTLPALNITTRGKAISSGDETKTFLTKVDIATDDPDQGYIFEILVPTVC